MIISPIIPVWLMIIVLVVLFLFINKRKPYTISKSLKLLTPYFLLISLTWVLLIVGWYIIGLPIGPGVAPTL